MKVERVEILPAAPQRPADAHKGTFGRVLVVAGSVGMSGAACLSGYGALRGGAGLVTLAVPRSILGIVAAVEPSWLTLPLADADGAVSAEASGLLEEVCSRQSAVAIGPGLGVSDGVRRVVESLYAECRLPVVVDADALNSLVGSSKLWREGALRAPRVWTPHPGEFARLTGQAVPSDATGRERCAVEFAAQHGVILVLKGVRTVITDGARLAVNTTGNSGMATGGTGDVLTGLVAALLAQGLDAFDAARLGAHLHGLAGDCVAEERGQRALIASDLAEALGAAWKRCLGERG